MVGFERDTKSTGTNASRRLPGRMKPGEVTRQLETISRRPFQTLAADLMGCLPTEDGLREFAAKHPDRWMSMIVLIAPLAGYRDAARQIHFDDELNRPIREMSDAELVAEMRQLGTQLENQGLTDGLAPVTIEHEPASPEGGK